MRVFKILFIGIIVSVFLAGQAYSAPKGNNGKSNKANNGNANKAKPQAAKAKVNNGNNKAVAQNKGQAAVHKQQARRSQEANRKREERNRFAQRKPNINNNNDLALNNRAARANNGRRNGAEIKKEKIQRVKDLVDSLKRARWSHNPHDTRGQGNMGKVDMLDPLGHDKGSNRKELKSDNGRPFHEEKKGSEPTEEVPPTEEEVPEIVEEIPIEELPVEEVPFLTENKLAKTEELISFDEMVAIDWHTEDSLIATFSGYIDYHNSLIDSGTLTDAQVEYHTAIIDTLQTWIVQLEPSDFQRFILERDYTIDYTLDLTTETESTYLIETTLVVAKTYFSIDNVWDPETGIYTEERTLRKKGDTIVLQSEEVTVTNEDGTYAFSYNPEEHFIDDSGGLYSLEVEVTDTTMELTTTQTYDRALYFYRCPYGKITDSRTAQVIVGAKITVHFDDGSIVSLDKATNKTANNPQVTDATGRFGFILQTNRKYYLTAKAEGYEDYQSEVFTEQWHVLREDIGMVPKLEQMASNME